MADYINSNILCQSYVHVEPAWLSSCSEKERNEKLKCLEEEIKIFAEKRMKFFLYDEVNIVISFERGSIRAKITAYGPMVLLFGNLVAGYGDFRDSVKAIASDSHKLASLMNLEILFQTKSRYKEEILGVESRKGIVGSIDRVNMKIDSINNKMKRNDNSPSVISKDLMELNSMILDLLSNIKDDNDIKAISNALLDGVSGFNLKKGRFKISDSVDQYMFQSLKKERQKIVVVLKNRII